MPVPGSNLFLCRLDYFLAYEGPLIVRQRLRWSRIGVAAKGRSGVRARLGSWWRDGEWSPGALTANPYRTLYFRGADFRHSSRALFERMKLHHAI